MAIWNEGNEDLLITLIQERPALYDITEKKYSNRVVKTGLWREIETQLGFSEKELRKKWDSLRTSYTRYRKLAPSGSCGAQRTGRQQWILTRLQFLEPYTKRKESTLNLTITGAGPNVEAGRIRPAGLSLGTTAVDQDARLHRLPPMSPSGI
ncbi:hypothetical protein NQZ68_030719 [Dissostichus eleginoides]|nr:hypothetical protein NQZ68_030719 [Dissostichus eleginoides]